LIHRRTPRSNLQRPLNRESRRGQDALPGGVAGHGEGVPPAAHVLDGNTVDVSHRRPCHGICQLVRSRGVALRDVLFAEEAWDIDVL
jgi:hypothetical protein